MVGLRHAFLLLGILVSAAHCNPADEAAKEGKDEGDGTGSGVTLVGTLAVTTGSSLNLTADLSKVDIYCSTYEESPATCTVPVASDGSFTANCDLAGKEFSCSLRENGIVKGDFPIAENLSILAGAGTIDLRAKVEQETGGVETSVDAGKSDALSAEAQAAAGAEELADTTWEKPITGEWTVACDARTAATVGFDGDERCPDGETVYLHEEAEDASLISVWDSSATYAACMDTVGSTSYSSSSPNWHVTVNGDMATQVAFDFTSLTALSSSLDAIHAALPSAIKASLDETALGIYLRALQFKRQISAIRKATTKEFGGILDYRVPSEEELRRRLVLRLVYLARGELDDLEFCRPLTDNETITTAYRRIHSVVPEMICQFKSDKAIAAVKTFVDSTLKASCLPKLFFDVVFNPASRNEELVLYCPGSSDKDGACFDSRSQYLGDIVGRHNRMSLSNRKDGVFDLVTDRVIEKTIINPKEGLVTCKIKSRATLRGRKIDDDVFDATISDHSVDRCEGSGASEVPADIADPSSGRLIQRGAKTWKATFTRS